MASAKDWATKTTAAAAVIKMPAEVVELYQKELVRWKVHIVPEPVAQRRRTSCPISMWGIAR
jgi:hypothetical protein